MDIYIYMHKTMGSVASLEKIEIIRSEEFMPSEVRLKFLKKMIILGPKTAILGPQFCRILVLGPHFWWLGGPGPQGPPGSTPGHETKKRIDQMKIHVRCENKTKLLPPKYIQIFKDYFKVISSIGKVNMVY